MVPSVVIPLLLSFEFVQQLVERFEAFLPRPFVGLDPVVDRLQRPAIQPVHPLPPFVAHVHQAHLPKDAQVFGHLWLSQAEQLDEVVHGPLAAGEDVQDLPPPGLRHRVERVRCRRCSGHGRYYMPIWEYVKTQGFEAGCGACAVRPR